METSSRIQRSLNRILPKQFLDGTHRCQSPQKTLEKLMPLTASFGITRVANVTGLDWIGIPVVAVYRPNARSLSVSQGKGTTLAAAKASGIMEAIECYHGEHLRLPIRMSSFHAMSRRHSVVDPRQLPLINHAVYHEHRELLWIEGYDLLKRKSVWVPYECVSNNFVDQSWPGSGCFGMTTNGLASGNHLLEALVHGFCEVVERDATTLWHAQKTNLQQACWLDLKSCEALPCREFITRIQESGLHLVVWDTTSDMGIPSFKCLLYEDCNDPSRLQYTASGMGCHLSRDIAFLRAVTEAAQSRLTLITGTREDSLRSHYGQGRIRFSDWTQFRELLHSYKPSRRFTSIPSFESDTFNKDLDLILTRLRTIGIQQAIVVPLSDSRLPFHVVKVLVPELESHDDHSKYSPGQRVKRLRYHT